MLIAPTCRSDTRRLRHDVCGSMTHTRYVGQAQAQRGAATTSIAEIRAAEDHENKSPQTVCLTWCSDDKHRRNTCSRRTCEQVTADGVSAQTRIVCKENGAAPTSARVWTKPSAAMLIYVLQRWPQASLQSGEATLWFAREMDLWRVFAWLITHESNNRLDLHRL